jgi:hypothetical protein
MKLLIVLGILAGLYTYTLLYNTDIVLLQTQHLNATYQYAANNAEKLATGH